ncbi:MAG: methylated-DNA--[protein]-cysteine S-methyltransferase [Gammaproteobacteria bacterium]|nr:methylated-DNA--[protein]-cysteine S-methyltransferase [Gammaproteobacteria bacterium]
MSKSGFALFDTAIGPCGLAWRPTGLVGVQLPEKTPGATRERLAARFADLQPAEPRGTPRRAREAMVALLAGRTGRSADLADIVLDMAAVTPFRRAVYAWARGIPRGETRTYGDGAAALGQAGGARAVGQALGANPFPIVVPCHRVLAAGGRPGGFSAAGGATTKLRMLEIEGALRGQGSLDLTLDHGMPYDLEAAVAHLRGADKRLARVIDAVGPCRMELKHTASVFAALADAIVYQQLSVKAAATILGRVVALMPRGRRGFNARNLMAVDDVALRGAGLSGNKLLALRDLATRTLSGELPTLARLRSMDDETAIEALTAVRGIGRWTVEMFLMFRLGRPDVMAVDDLGLRQGHARMLGQDGETERRQLMAYAERWRPYRSVASWYLWRAVELAREG